MLNKNTNDKPVAKKKVVKKKKAKTISEKIIGKLQPSETFSLGKRISKDLPLEHNMEILHECIRDWLKPMLSPKFRKLNYQEQINLELFYNTEGPVKLMTLLVHTDGSYTVISLNIRENEDGSFFLDILPE